MGDGGTGDADTEKLFYFKQTKSMPVPGSQISRVACSGVMNPPNLTGEVGFLSPAFAKYILYAGKGARISPVGAGAAGWAGRVQVEQEGDPSITEGCDTTEWIYLASRGHLLNLLKMTLR